MTAMPLLNQPGAAPASPASPGKQPVGLLMTLLAIGLLTAPCGILLIVNKLGMPLTVLAGTPFDSFLIPGLLLAIVVGGSLLGAAWLVWVGQPRAWLASLAAGLILLGWTVTEAVMIADGRPLQAIVLLTALLIIGFAWRARPEPVRPAQAPRLSTR